MMIRMGNAPTAAPADIQARLETFERIAAFGDSAA
jgi:hypothetical protein